MSIRGKVCSTVAVVALLLGLSAPAFAVGDTSTGSNIQPYAADKPLDVGTIVKLTGEKSNKVVPATQAELQNMFGVVIDGNQLPITYTGGETVPNETFVAVSGTHKALASTQAGVIEPGDYVTLSSIDGVLMKAGTEEKTIFGRAQGSFDGKGLILGTAQLKDTNGKPTKTVQLGSLQVTIDIKSNPNIKTTKANVPDFLERVGQQIAEKEVSPVRIYLSVAISVVSLIMAIAVLYAGIRNGVIAIGRNPMSKKSIFRALMEVILTSLLILIIGLFAVYLLLKL